MNPALACHCLFPGVSKIVFENSRGDGLRALERIYADGQNIVLEGWGRKAFIDGNELVQLMEDDLYEKIRPRALAAYQRLVDAVTG